MDCQQLQKWKKNGSAASLSLSLHSFQDKNFIAFSSIHLRPVDIMSLNDIETRLTLDH